MRPISSSTSSGVPSLSHSRMASALEVVAGVHEVLDRRGHRLVHHLQPGRDDAGGDHRRHRVAGLADVVEAGHDAARQLRLGHQLDGDLGGHGQHAFAADQHAAAGRSPAASSASQPNSTASPSTVKPRTAQHVVQRQAVFQAVHAAGVLGHVAADGAGDLARLGRARSTGRSGAAASLMARLRTPHCTTAVRAARVDLEDLVELGQRQRHAQRDAACAPPDRPVPAPRATTGTLQRVAGAQHGRHLRLGLGQRHHQRALAVGGQAVAFVGRRCLRACHSSACARQQRLQRGTTCDWRGGARPRLCGQRGGQRCVQGLVLRSAAAHAPRRAGL